MTKQEQLKKVQSIPEILGGVLGAGAGAVGSLATLDLMKSDKLKASAKNNIQKDFEFSYFDDVLIEGL